MGLLEKALKYKKEMNSKGHDTLIDRIQGPAETEFIKDDEIETPEVEADQGQSLGKDPLELEGDEIFALPSEEGVPELGEVASPRDEISLDQLEDDFSLKVESGDKIAPVIEERLDIMPDPLGPDDYPPPLKVTDGNNDPMPEERDAAESANDTDPGPIILDESEEGSLSQPDGAGHRPDEGDLPREEGVLEEEGPIGRSLREGKRFHDFMVLYEIGKEIVKAKTREELYDVVLFSIIGQIGVSSSSILVADAANQRRWVIADSRGIAIKYPTMLFDASAGILGNMFKRREVIDLDEWKTSPEHADEYYKFVSIDARLISPISYDKNIFGAITLGEKITIGDYTEAEKDFILSISEIAAVALERINAVENSIREVKDYRLQAEFHGKIDDFQTALNSRVDLESARNAVMEVLRETGIESYAIFLRDEKENAFLPAIVDPEDSLGIESSAMRIQFEHPLSMRLCEERTPLRVVDLSPFDSIQSVFSEAQLRKMNVFFIDPYCFGTELKGFMGAFKLSDSADEKTAGNFLSLLSGAAIPGLIQIQNEKAARGKYVDAIEPPLRRVRATFERTRDLGVPITLVYFSMKNFKRYQNLYGPVEAAELLSRFEKVLVSRLSDSDFCVRLERNKFLLVLPGKNKKFAIPLANSIRNEVTQSLKKREMQLMLVYLTAEFPEDGDELNALIDSIDSV